MDVHRLPVTVVDLNGQQHNIWYFPRFNYKPVVDKGELIIRTYGDLFGRLYTNGGRQGGQQNKRNSNAETAEVSTGAASAAPSTYVCFKTTILAYKHTSIIRIWTLLYYKSY